jgi:hypothetical protein
MDLESAREARGRGLDVRTGAEDAPPAEGVDDERSADVAAVGVHGGPRAALDLGRLELGLAALLPEQLAEAAVVEGRERPRKGPEGHDTRRPDADLAKRLEDRVLEAQVHEPVGRRGARARLALADLVAVDHQDARAAAAQLARGGVSRERGATDHNVPVPAQGSPLCSALRGSHRHRAEGIPARPPPGLHAY